MAELPAVAPCHPPSPLWPSCLPCPPLGDGARMLPNDSDGARVLLDGARVSLIDDARVLLGDVYAGPPDRLGASDRPARAQR